MRSPRRVWLDVCLFTPSRLPRRGILALNAKEVEKFLRLRAVDRADVRGPDTVNKGVPEGRVFVVTQSVDVAHCASAAGVSEAERTARRAALGPKDACSCTSVGSTLAWE